MPQNRTTSARKLSPGAILLLAGALLALRSSGTLIKASAMRAPPTTASTSQTTSPTTSNSTSAALKIASSSPGAKQAEAIRVNFTDCGAKNIKEVRIWPCPGDGTVCNINLGTNVTVEADFVAKHEAVALTEIIKGVIRGRELQFPEQRADPCKSTISPSCPIKAGKHYQYKATFEVKAHYPAIPVKVRYALANAAGDYVACVQIAAKIVDPSPSVRSARTKPKKKSS